MRLKHFLAVFFKYFFLTVGALFMIFPFIWMVMSSLKTHGEIIQTHPALFPKHFYFANYVNAFSKAPFGKYFLNSLIVMVVNTVLTTIVTIFGSFSFSRLKFKGKEILFSFLLSLMMLPFEMLIITNYTTIVKMKLFNTLPALILPFISSIFYVYILRNFFDTVPDSIYYSARLDGASNWKFLWKVMVPLAKPSIFTIVLLNALSSWNSFMWPLYITSDSKARTLPYGLQVFTTEAGSFPGELMAASTVIVLPMILIFIIARKYIVSGVSRGGIKG